MALTGADITGHGFRHGVRGYDRREVDAFLRDVAEQVTASTRERERLQAELRAARDQVTEGAESERLLKRTLVAAQRTADETVATAREEAARVLNEAAEEAEGLLTATRQQVAQEREASRRLVERVRDAVLQLRRFRDDYGDRVRLVVAEQLAALDRAGELPDLPSDLDELVRSVTAAVEAAAPAADHEVQLEPASALGEGNNDEVELVLDVDEPAVPRRALD